MTFTTANWHLYNAPRFVAALPDAEVGTAAVRLSLRQYDIDALYALVSDRWIVAKRPQRRIRAQSWARRYSWWGDVDAVIPQGLLILCAMTQRLRPQPKRDHTRPCGTCGGSGRARVTPRTRGAKDWSQVIEVPCPAPGCAEMEAWFHRAEFPFRQTDGQRGHPTEEIDPKDDKHLGLVDAWLPQVVAERLVECGQNYQDQGPLGVADQRGAFHPLNRSAAVRRLLEAVACRHMLVDHEAPVLFRGVGIAGLVAMHPARADHLVEARAQLHESNLLRAQAAAAKPVEGDIDPRSAQQKEADMETLRHKARAARAEADLLLSEYGTRITFEDYLETDARVCGEMAAESEAALKPPDYKNMDETDTAHAEKEYNAALRTQRALKQRAEASRVLLVKYRRFGPAADETPVGVEQPEAQMLRQAIAMRVGREAAKLHDATKDAPVATFAPPAPRPVAEPVVPTGTKKPLQGTKRRGNLRASSIESFDADKL